MFDTDAEIERRVRQAIAALRAKRRQAEMVQLSENQPEFPCYVVSAGRVFGFHYKDEAQALVDSLVNQLGQTDAVVCGSQRIVAPMQPAVRS